VYNVPARQQAGAALAESGSNDRLNPRLLELAERTSAALELRQREFDAVPPSMNRSIRSPMLRVHCAGLGVVELMSITG